MCVESETENFDEMLRRLELFSLIFRILFSKSVWNTAHNIQSSVAKKSYRLIKTCPSLSSTICCMFKYRLLPLRIKIRWKKAVTVRQRYTVPKNMVYAINSGLLVQINVLTVVANKPTPLRTEVCNLLGQMSSIWVLWCPKCSTDVAYLALRLG